MNILEAIKQRRSVRRFDGRVLTDNMRARLLRAIDESFSPFGGRVTIRLKRFDLKAGYKPGTYGFISGAEDYFLIAMADDDASRLTAGFRFEQVVLEACRAGLGTCWIAGTYRGSDFDCGQTWPEGEHLQAVCPVGVALKPGLKEKIILLSVGSDRRKPWESLFFIEDFDRPLTRDNRFAPALEMLRLAPSSSNSQPWRALVQGDTVHFYRKSTGRWTLIDCGIALSHFYLTEQHLHPAPTDQPSGNPHLSAHPGTFLTAPAPPPPPPAGPAGLEYLTSYRRSE